MTKDWTFDQPLDDNTPTSSTEERAKIAALFHQEKQQEPEEVDYVAEQYSKIVKEYLAC